MSAICPAWADLDNWVHSKEHWIEIAYEKREGESRYKTTHSTIEIKSGMVPFAKGTIVGIYEGPLSPKPFHILGIGYITLSNKTSSNVFVLFSFTPNLKIDQIIRLKNFQIVIATEKVKDVVKTRYRKF